MVEYMIKTPPLERLGTAVAEALAEGVTQQELISVVLSTVATYTPPLPDEADCEDFQAPSPDGDRVKASLHGYTAASPPSHQDLTGEIDVFVEQHWTVYTELPPGLIDLPSAAQKYGLNQWTLRNWVRKGHLKMYGRLKGSAKGGGFILVRESELRLYKDMPKSKGGRPRKT